MPPTACIIMPTYNEAPNIRALIPEIFSLTPSIPTHELHLLIVDDSSPDGTADVVLLLLLAKAFGVWYVAANLVGIAVASLVNYAISSRWTWRHAARPAAASAAAAADPADPASPP